MWGPISLPRLSLTTWPKMTDDIVEAATLYYTDGTTIYSELGPWPANAKRDVFLSSSGLFYTVPWVARTGPQPPKSSDQYLGSINPDENGLLNRHFRPGPLRRCDVWNAWNQEEIELIVADSGVQTKIIEASNDANWQPITPDSCADIVIGLPGSVSAFYKQMIGPQAQGANPNHTGGCSAWGGVAIGFNQSSIPYVWPANPPTNPDGFWGQYGMDNSIWDPSGNGLLFGACAEADHTEINFCGDAQVWALYCSTNVAGNGASGNPSTVAYYRRNMPANGRMRVRYWG